MFCDTQRTTQLLHAGEKIYKSSSTNSQSWGGCVTNLSMMSEFAITLATPKYSVGKGYCGTIYLRIKKHCDRQQTTTTLVLFKTYHGPSQTASDQGKPHEQDQLGFPCHPVTAVRIAVGDQPRLLDRVDPGYQRTSATGECVGAGGGYVHEHSQHAADQRDPVRERDMDITVVRDLAVHRGIDEEPES